MPTYDYRCEQNGRVVEVQHRMSEKLLTWGELCALAGIEPGDTPPDASVSKVLTAGNVVRAEHLRFNGAPCEMGGACCGARGER